MKPDHTHSHNFGKYRKCYYGLYLILLTLSLAVILATPGYQCYAFPIANNPDILQLSTSAAFDGTNYLVGFQEKIGQARPVSAQLVSVPPKISVSPRSLNFGNAKLGGTSVKTITIKNTGTSDLVIAGIDITGANSSEFSQTNDCTTIPAGSSCVVTGTFAPALLFGKKSAIVGITSNDPQKPTLNVKVSGNVPPPKISASPMSLNLGNAKLGGTSVKTITIKNTGTSDLVIAGIDITGLNASEFSQTNDCTTIPEGGSCVITETFAPTLLFGKKSAIVGITSNDTKKPTVNVKVSGNAPPPKISASPVSLNFGSVEVGSTSSPKTITIKNTGTSDLVIAGIDITGLNASEFSQTNDCTTIPEGGSCVITETFAPTSIGSKSATMSISSDDPKKPTVNVKLSGMGTSSPCTYSISASGQQFDASGGTESVSVTALNGCSWTATSNASWITITSGSSGNGDGSVTYTVAANTGTSQRTGTMTIAGQTFNVTQVKNGSEWPSEGIVFDSSRDGWNGIWVMNTDGSNPRRLSSVSKVYGGDNYPSSSPDGSKIVFARDDTGIVVIDDSGEEIVKNYSMGDGPWYTTWSYNGTIYFTRWNNHLPGSKEYIYAVNEDGTGEVQVSPQYNSTYNATDRDPSISPDGTTLVFSTNREGVVAIATMIIGSGSLVYLTDITGLGSATITPAEQPSWSPDGSKIAFSAYPGYPDWTRKEQIYVMNADGSGKVALTSETGAGCSNPSWSPDGSKIVFQKEYPGFSSYNEIWIMNADGSGAKALTDRNVTGYDAHPCFIKKPR